MLTRPIRRFRRFALLSGSLLTLVALLPLLSAPSPGVAAPAEAPAAQQDIELRLLRRSPDDGETEVAVEAALLLQFNVPVQPVTALSETPDREVIRLSPPAAGAGRWITSTMYRFDPAGGWQGSTTYQLMLNPDLRGLQGQPLAGAPAWSFSTVLPAVVAVSPGRVQRPTPETPGRPAAPAPPGNVSPGAAITVRFNQPVSRAAAEAALACDPAITGAFSWPDDKTMRLQPSAPLPRSATIQCTERAGVPAANGGGATASDYTWDIAVQPGAGVQSTTPREGQATSTFNSISISFATPMDQESVGSRLSLEPPAEGGLRFIWSGDNHVSIEYAGRARTTYRLTIAEGARDLSGDLIRQPFVLNFSTSGLAPAVTLTSDSYATIAPAGTIPSVSIISTNVGSAGLRLYRTNRTSFIAGPSANGFPSGAEELRRWQAPLENTPDMRVTTRVPLVDEPLAPGYYLLWLETTDPTRPIQKPLLVTRTHLTVKESYDRVLVWAVDFASGEPLPDLDLQARTLSGAAIGQGRTDSRGIATFPRASAYSFSDRTVVSGSRDGDEVLALSDWQDERGFPYGPTLTGALITDRPIYRTAETVAISGFVRADNDAALSLPASGSAFTLTVNDSRFREIARQSVQLDDYGMFLTTVDIAGDAATGTYSVRLEGGARQFVGSASFVVNEFRRPDFAVTVKAPADLTSGDTAEVTAGGELFFGAPVQNADVNWTVRVARLTFAPRDYPGYSFSDTDPDGVERSPVSTLANGTARTDQRGVARFSTPLDISALTSSQIATIEATITDATGQAISNRTTTRVHKAERYAGLRAREYVNVAGKPLSVALVSVDQQARPVAGDRLDVRIVERRWETVRVRGVDGEPRSESRPVDREIDVQGVMTGGDGRASVQFTPDRGGFYRVIATGHDSAGREYRAAVGIWVSSSEYVPWRISSDARLTLVADQERYQPGDTARILVQSPFAGGVALVTVERAGVLSSDLKRFEGNSTLLEIPLERVAIPNVFLSVALFKPGEGGERYQFRSGSLELRVSAEGQRLNITLTAAPEQTGPRGRITFAVRTTDANGNGVPAELSMMLVDEAILTLTQDRSVDLFDRFYQRRQHGVTTTASGRASIPPFQAQPQLRATPARTGTAAPAAATATRAATAAAAAQRPAGAPAAPEEPEPEDIRSDFRYTAHVEGALRTDAAGNGTLVAQMPDTLTLWRMTARGITIDTQTGIARAQVRTAKPLVVRPAAPRFFTGSDRPVLGAAVLNLSEQALDVRVSLTASGAAIEGEPAQSVRLAAGAEATVSWQARVLDPNGSRGSATLRWSAAGAGLSDAVELTLPVYQFATPEVTASSGAVREQVTEVVRSPSTADLQAIEVLLSLWPSLTAALPDTVRSLRDYPWESAEVRASRLLTLVGLAQAQGTAPDAAEAGRLIDLLIAQRGTDGGWGWWPAYESDPAITAHVALALLTARDADIAMPAATLSSVSAYLGRQLDSRQDLHPNVRAAMTLALVSLQPAQVQRAVDLAEEREIIGPEAKALIILAMRRGEVGADDPRLRPLLSDLISAATQSAGSTSWDDLGRSTRLTTATRTTALAMWALAATDAEHPLVDGAIRWLMNERREGSWSSTRDSAMSVVALGAVARARAEGDAAYRYRVTLNGVSVQEGTVARAGTEPAVETALRGSLQPGDNPLAMSRDPEAPGRLYYQISYRVLRPGESAASQDHGMAVAREFLSSDGQDRPLTSARVGDIVKIRVTVLAPASMNYVQVEDYLPAGLEILDPTLRTTTGSASAILQADRERQSQLQRVACLADFRACSTPFRQADLRDDRVGLFARTMAKGAYQYVYLARAATPGSYVTRPALAQEVYFPEVWGRSDSGRFNVEP